MRNNLKQLRKDAGYTQQGLADVLGVGRESVLRWENGDMPGLAVADALAAALRVSIYEIWPEMQSARHDEYRLKEAHVEGYNEALSDFMEFGRESV